ncbi:PepSY-associated TM helix domain-containing protein [Tritonibacter horizontis]|uniref:PepSY-associated TM helix n=1 Tax=Tritonibacter horizontis TaxID=1768241 RepID=A0A132BVC7_9RHOB|nr:PepSY domain-containing protein [Tritonibacter horizontis]KUP92146.1 PepSY-associated TM helix [Tritonibacter horizontis]
MANSQTVGADHSSAAKNLSQKFYFAAWRWHFYAGLYVIPFLIMLAITGLSMMYISVFDGRDGEYVSVPVGETVQPIAVQTQAALEAMPGSTLVEWIGPKAEDRAAVVRVAVEGGNRMIAVDPYSADVVETWDRRAGWYDFLQDIHGTLLIGTTGDRMIEIAAGLAIVLVLTGLYLWWPRDDWKSAFVPRLAARGRALWKSLHAVVGVYISILLVLFLLSGLSWAGIWGERFVQAWSTFPAQKWEAVPLSDTTHAGHMNHGATKDVPWALEQTLMPESGSDAGLTGLPEGTPVTGDSIAALARALGYEGRFRIVFPRDDAGVYTINQDSMSNDSHCPTCDRTVHIDQFTGKILADVGFADYSLAGKSMAVGIALHEGDMGLWNIVLNTLFCLSVIFVCVSGVVMWVKRRPSRAGRLSAPPLPADLPFWKGAVLIGLFTSLAFPLVGITLLAVLALDVLLLSNLPLLKRAVS